MRNQLTCRITFACDVSLSRIRYCQGTFHYRKRSSLVQITRTDFPQLRQVKILIFLDSINMFDSNISAQIRMSFKKIMYKAKCQSLKIDIKTHQFYLRPVNYFSSSSRMCEFFFIWHRCIHCHIVIRESRDSTIRIKTFRVYK